MSDYLKELEEVKRYMVEPDDGVLKYHFQEWKTGTVVFYADVEELIQNAIETKNHTSEWYAVRHQLITEWLASTGLSKEKIDEYWNIRANGTKGLHTPPTYQQQMNMLKWELKKAQKRIEELETKP